MILTTPRRDAVRIRLIAAGAALAAALLVAAAALALLLGSRRRAVREIDRAASDLATSSARLLLQEMGNFTLDATNMLLFAAERRGVSTAIAPDSLLARLTWSQRMALLDSTYEDSLRVAFSGDANAPPRSWRWSGAMNDTLRRTTYDKVESMLAKSPRGATLLGGAFPWHADDMSMWIIVGRTADGRATFVEGVGYSRTKFVTAFVPKVLRTVPILPASVAGARWDLTDPQRAFALQQRYVSVRVEDIGSDRVEFDTGVLASEGAHGEYALTSGPGQGVRVRVGLADTLTDALTERVPSGVPEWTLWVLLTIAVGLAVVAGVITQRAFAGIAQRQRFLAAVWHELRTPLTQVRLSVETLRRLPADGDERRARTLEALGRGTEQLTRTVENLLTLAKAELPTWKVRPRPTELESLVRTAVESMTPIAATRRVSFDLVTAPVWARVDPDAFRQVVLNLLDNALKYGPRDFAVQVRLRSYGDIAELSVADHGPGIPIDQRDRVWDAYERLGANGTAAKRDGLGLGLSVVRDIVQRHDGWVRVEENIGGGSVFLVGVPLVGEGDALPPTTAEYPISHASPG